jgi:branched-chain amino acid transport system permease protein
VSSEFTKDKKSGMGKKVLPWLIAVVLLCFVPVVIRDDYLLHIAIIICVYIILVSGLRLIMSTGQCSFAHAAFWGIGGYTSALLVMRIGLSFWISLPLAGITAAVFAVPIGLICLRLKGPYFFIITLAFGQLILLIEKSWVGLTKGTSGIFGVPAPDSISIGSKQIIEFSSKASFLYLGIFLMLIILLVMLRLEKSRFGMACEAIRESDDLAETVGINPLKYKMIAFVVACFFAGVVGSFYSHYIKFISPDFFGVRESLTLLIFMMVGGVSSVIGSVIGSTFMTLLRESLRPVAAYEPIIYGFILVIVLLFLPGGILSLPRRMKFIRTSKRPEEKASGSTRN